MREGVPELKIRRARAEDSGELGRVSALSWREAYGGILPPEYLETVTPELRGRLFREGFSREKRTEYYLACVPGEPAGFLVLRPAGERGLENCGEIAAVYLRKAFWGLGYGKSLMEFALGRLRAVGCERAALWTLEKNVRARNFYERNGFHKDGAEQTIKLGESFLCVRYLRKLVP